MVETGIDYKALAKWAICGDTGISSMALARYLTGMTPDADKQWRDYPWDGGDMGRCICLIQQVPGLRPLLHNASGMGPEWARIVARWDELERLHRAAYTRGNYGTYQEWAESPAMKAYVTTVRSVVHGA